jgi:hypothetical protein
MKQVGKVQLWCSPKNRGAQTNKYTQQQQQRNAQDTNVNSTPETTLYLLNWLYSVISVQLSHTINVQTGWSGGIIDVLNSIKHDYSILSNNIQLTSTAHSLQRSKLMCRKIIVVTTTHIKCGRNAVFSGFVVDCTHEIIHSCLNGWQESTDNKVKQR